MFGVEYQRYEKFFVRRIRKNTHLRKEKEKWDLLSRN